MTSHSGTGKRMASRWDVEVPCKGCTLCCENNDLIVLRPLQGDDPSLYETQVIAGNDPRLPVVMSDIHGPAMVALKQSADGSCIYCAKGQGCTIHDHRPIVCRTFDCANMAMQITGRGLGMVNDKVVQKGLERAREERRHAKRQG